jgi:hypothetical protein
MFQRWCSTTNARGPASAAADGGWVRSPVETGRRWRRKEALTRAGRDGGPRGRRLTMGLATPKSSRQKLQNSLQTKAKAEPAFRFYSLWANVCRADILDEAYRHSRSNGGRRWRHLCDDRGPGLLRAGAEYGYINRSHCRSITQYRLAIRTMVPSPRAFAADQRRSEFSNETCPDIGDALRCRKAQLMRCPLKGGRLRPHFTWACSPRAYCCGVAWHPYRASGERCFPNFRAICMPDRRHFCLNSECY